MFMLHLMCKQRTLIVYLSLPPSVYVAMEVVGIQVNAEKLLSYTELLKVNTASIQNLYDIK